MGGDIIFSYSTSHWSWEELSNLRISADRDPIIIFQKFDLNLCVEVVFKLLSMSFFFLLVWPCTSSCESTIPSIWR